MVNFYRILTIATILVTTHARAAVTAGGMAIIGFDDDADSFTTVALDDIAAGETVYFTNNGWNTSLGNFPGVFPDQGAGNEGLLKFTATATISRGTIISSTTNGSSWQWTRSGLIPGQTIDGVGEFGDLPIDHESDQFYIFQSTSTNPLSSPSSFIYALHLSSSVNPTFSEPVDNLTGDLPTSLSQAAHTAFAHTTHSFHGDGAGNNSSWGLNLSSPTVAALQLSGATKAQWLSTIASSANWSSGQPTSLSLNFSLVPEPNRILLTALGLFGCTWTRRRKRS
jgi:hypothetical protein